MGDDRSISDAAPRSFPRNVKLYYLLHTHEMTDPKGEPRGAHRTLCESERLGSKTKTIVNALRINEPGMHRPEEALIPLTALVKRNEAKG